MSPVAGLFPAVVIVLAMAACGCASPDPRTTVDPSLRLLKFAQFEAADTDHSGKLSRVEAQALPVVARYFREMDTDKNGEVSWQEVTHLDLRAVRRNELLPPGP